MKQTTIGPVAKKRRLEMGLKQKDVAKDIGTSSGNLCRFENGQQGISVPLMDKLSAILDFTIYNESIIPKSSPDEIEDIVEMLRSLKANQLAAIKGVIVRFHLDNKS